MLLKTSVQDTASLARGEVSELIWQYLTDSKVQADSDPPQAARALVGATTDILTDGDAQMSLFMLYASHYGALPQLRAEIEWDPRLIETRLIFEEAFEEALRANVVTPPLPEPTQRAVADALFELTSPTPGPSLARFIAKKATLEQAREFLIHRSIYTLREADPHSWAIPRLTGIPKAALVEIQADEYGGGRPHRVHSTIFAKTMRGVGLDATYGAYLSVAPVETLTSMNAMSMFGLNRRLLGAIVGHLAAFEMTSSIPNRFYGDGFRRLGFDDEVTDYFDEHVEADAVHEQIAAHDLAGSLAAEHPEYLPDIMFGAAACLAVDDWAAQHMQEAWEANTTSLRTELQHEG